MAIIYDLPAAEYHARPEISKSGLDKIAQFPALFKAHQNRPPESDDALIIGQATHTLTLEPEKFTSEFCVMPAGLDRRTKEGKALAAELEASGKTILTNSQYELCSGIALSVRANTVALDYLTNGAVEVSFTAEIEGVHVRGRCDYLHPNKGIIDLKTTKSASARSFAKSIAEYRYHVQAALYTDLAEANGLFIPDFTFIAVEKTYPYAVAIYQVDREGMERGREIYRRDLALYKHCLEMDDWPGYPEEVQVLSLPAWA